jgi:hypothetical protein
VLAPPEIAEENRRGIGLFSNVIAGETCKKIFQKCVNTRENSPIRAWTSFSAHRDTCPRPTAVSGGLRCCSFSLVKVSQTFSQLIHMRSILVLASGLESRNSRQNRQEKKLNFIFHREQKFS